jgi:O-antigen/teichoic acid export membrane protein
VLRELVSFGGAASLNQVLNHAARSGDTFVVGRLLGPAVLGLYGRAYHLVTLPLGYVGDVMWQVLFPAMSEARGDRARLGRAYLLSVQASTLVAAPLMAGMAVAAPHLVAGIYGAQWTGAALPLQILCLAGALRSVYHVSGALTHATGRVLSEVGRQAGFAALVVAGAWVGARQGLGGVAVGIVVATAFMYVAMGHLSLRIVQLRWADFFGAQAAGLVLAAAVAAPALAVRILLERGGAGSLVILVALLATCAGALAAGLHLLPVSLRPVELYRRLDVPLTRLPRRVRGPVIRMLGASAA